MQQTCARCRQRQQCNLLFSDKPVCRLSVEIVCWSYKRNYITQKMQVRRVRAGIAMLLASRSHGGHKNEEKSSARCRLFFHGSGNNLQMI